METIAREPAESRYRETCRQEHAHCFACGDPAEGGLGLRFAVQPDGGVAAEWSCPAGGESFPGLIHGGLVATLLDSAMLHGLFTRGMVGRTGELHVRYRQPVLIGLPVIARAWLREQHGALFQLEAELRQGGSLCARARAKFMARPARPAEQ